MVLQARFRGWLTQLRMREVVAKAYEEEKARKKLNDEMELRVSDLSSPPSTHAPSAMTFPSTQTLTFS